MGLISKAVVVGGACYIVNKIKDSDKKREAQAQGFPAAPYPQHNTLSGGSQHSTPYAQQYHNGPPPHGYQYPTQQSREAPQNYDDSPPAWSPPAVESKKNRH